MFQKLTSVPKSLNEQLYCNLIQINKKYIFFSDTRELKKIAEVETFILFILGSPVSLA